MSSFNPTTRTLLKSALALGVGGGLTSLAGVALAQQAKALVEGTEYTLIKPPQTPETQGKIEVVEFFWLGCPHCFALEPLLKDWVRKLPADVLFRKVHVPFNEVKHQQLYYTLVAMGKADELTDKVFNGIHVERNHLDTLDKMTAFLGKQGVDAKAFTTNFESFSVQTMMRKATAMAAAYKVDSVPLLAINGKYMTAPSMAGSNGAALAAADVLIDRERKGR